MKSDGSKEETIEKGEVMSRRLIIFLGLLFVVVAVISTSVIFNIRGDESSDSRELDPLIEGLSSSAEGLPEYSLVSTRTKAGYRAATEIPEILEKMPCYCSCGAIGHKSLKDCFIDGDGFEEHASYCDLCVDEALDVYRWQKEGVPLAEIRSMIDEKYLRFGEPTDTPPI